MGISKIFAHDADLSGLLEENDAGSPLKVSQVIHRAIIEVNEHGSSAAATTGDSILQTISKMGFAC